MLIKTVLNRIDSSLYSKGVASDDSRFSDRHKYSIARSIRSTLLPQKLSKKQKVNEECYSILECIELVEVPPVSCPCLPQVGCTVYRNRHKLPSIIEGLNRERIDWVMTPDASREIPQTTRRAYQFNKGNKYTSVNTRYIYEGGFLYVYGKHVPKMVNVKILPEDPIEVSNFIDPSDCRPYVERDFKFFGSLSTLVDLAAKELLDYYSKTREDSSNNTKDNTEKETK